MTVFVGIDPGEKTGVGIYDDSNGHKEFHEVAGGYEGFLEWALDTGAWGVLNGKDTKIIYEKFTLRSQDFVANTTPLEINGAIKLLSRLYKWDTSFATPAQHKTLISNEAMKRGGMYPPRGSVLGGHSTDGMRLICWYIISRIRNREFSEKLFPKK